MRIVKHAEFPLWDAGGLLNYEFEELPEELPLIRETYEGLVEWNAEAESILGTEAALAAHRSRGHQLFNQVRAELAPHFEVRHNQDYDYNW